MYCPGLSFFSENIPNIVYEKSLNMHLFLHHFGLLSKDMKKLKVCHPKVFFQNLQIIVPEFEPGYQQDAHEFLLSLLNIFDDECARSFGKTHDYFDTPIHALFGSTLTEQKICGKCHHITSSTFHVLDISIPLNSVTIEDCITNFMSPGEAIPDFTCEQCNSVGTCSVESFFESTPYILIITMMRFTSTNKKIENNVDFDFQLDIDFCTKTGQHTLYELFAIIIHNGHSIGSGHFTAAFKIGENWYSADDATVTKIYVKSIKTSKPYILFYRRKYEMEPIYVHFGDPNEE